MTTNRVPTDRALALLHDVIRDGGQTGWRELHAMGHHFSTVQSCVRHGWLRVRQAYLYEVTSAGWSSVAQNEARP